MVNISWNLKLVGPDTETGVSRSNVATQNSDIGFTVLIHKHDGTLPMLLPYKYLSKQIALC